MTLPDWTENRLIVGLIIAVWSTIVAAIQGILAWYIPILTLITFGLFVLAIAYGSEISSVIRRMTANLHNAVRAVLTVGAGAILFFLFLTVASSFIASVSRMLDGKTNEVSSFSGVISPVLAYSLLLITRWFRRANTTLGAGGSHDKTPLALSLGSDLCVLSTFAAYLIALLFLGTNPLPEFPVLVFTFATLNLTVLFLAIFLERGSGTQLSDGLMGKLRTYILPSISSLLGVAMISSTTNAIVGLLEVSY